MKVKCDHRSKFSNLSNWKEEARIKLLVRIWLKIKLKLSLLLCPYLLFEGKGFHCSQDNG